MFNKMKFITAAIISSVLLLTGCNSGDGKGAKEVYKDNMGFSFETVAHFKSDDFRAKIVRETEAKYCMLYMWDGAGNGGPALAPIPCEESNAVIDFDSRFVVLSRSSRVLNEVNDTSYAYILKDTKYNSCYIHMWDGAGNGGPALASVPCEAHEKKPVEDVK